MSFISNCPRCGSRTFETLQTYSHCSECLYFVDSWNDMATVHLRAIREGDAVLSSVKPKVQEPTQIEQPEFEGPPNEAA